MIVHCDYYGATIDLIDGYCHFIECPNRSKICSSSNSNKIKEDK